MRRLRVHSFAHCKMTTTTEKKKNALLRACALTSVRRAQRVPADPRCFERNCEDHACEGALDGCGARFLGASVNAVQCRSAADLQFSLSVCDYRYRYRSTGTSPDFSYGGSSNSRHPGRDRIEWRCPPRSLAQGCGRRKFVVYARRTSQPVVFVIFFL